MEGSPESGTRIDVLGPLAVSVDGQPVSIGGPRSQAILVTLAHHLDEVVSVDVLSEALWIADPPKSARNVVQVQVSGLRRALGPSADIQTQGRGYLLASAGISVDVAEFEHLARFAGELLDSDPVAAAEGAAAAEGLWRGSPAAEELDLAPVRGRLQRLVELRLRTLATMLDARLRSGDHQACCEDASLLARDHPFREDFRALQMLALYRSGRQAEALAAYRGTRDLLVEEFGIEPGPDLQSLQRQILEQDRRLDLPPPGAEMSTTESSRSSPDPTLRSDNLHAEANEFVERPEIATVLRTLAPGRVVTVAGTGGIGKSRCVSAAARRCLGTERFADGVWLVDLSSLQDGSVAVASSVASALRLGQRPGSTATDEVVDYLRDRRSLIVLDNCEHVLESVVAFAETVAAASPSTAFLAASRVRLGIAAESVVTMNRLDDNAAHRLLAARIAEAGAGPFSDEECAELCDVLDNYPLAIELAAARTRSLAPREIAARLGDQPALLGSSSTSGERAEVPGRQPGRRYADLSTALDWSLRQLSPHASDVLGRATVFISSFDLEGAEAVLTTPEDRPGDVIASLGELVEHHLVARDHRAGRFHILEPIRHHLRDGARDDVRERYGQYYGAFARAAAVGLRGPDEAYWWDRFRAELPHVRQVVQWATDNEDIDLLDSIMGEMAFAIAILACIEPGEWAIESLGELRLEPAHAPGLAAAAAANLALHTRIDESDALLDAITGTTDPLIRSVIATIRGINHPTERRWPDEIERSAVLGGGEAFVAFAKAGQQAPDMIDVVDAVGNPSLRVFARCMLSASLPDKTGDEARRNKEELYRIALTSNNSRTIAEGQTFMALQHCFDGEPGRAGPLVAEMIERMIRLRSPGLVWHGVEVIANMLAMVRVEPYASAMLWSAVTNAGFSPFSRVLRDPTLPQWVAAQLSDDDHRRAVAEGASLDIDAAARDARKAAERLSAA